MGRAQPNSAVESDSFTFDEIGLAILGGLGALALAAGVVGYFYIGSRGILLGLLAFTLSRALMRFWQIARPHRFPRNRAVKCVSRKLPTHIRRCAKRPFWTT